MKKLFLIRYGEVFLKSEFVMKRMIKLLARDISLKLREKNLEGIIHLERGRIFLTAPDQASEILKKTFGIVSFSPIIAKLPLNKLEKYVKTNALDLLGASKSFAIRVKRVGIHDFTSKQLEEKLGAIIVESTKAKVDLKNPQKEIFVEVRGNVAYIFTEIIKGPGGLPSGSSSKLIILLSSGIDSPVAAWLIARRGARIISLHFVRGKYGPDDRKKTVEIIKKIREWYPYKIKLCLLNYEKCLSEFIKHAPYTCILCKRMMMRIASILGIKNGCKGVVTGDSLGEVASQTLENLKLETEVSSLPVYRPLIAYDKDEIVKKSKEIGTYEISIKEKDYCKALPKKPKTKATEEEIEKIESKIDINSLIKETLKTLEVIKI